VTSIYNDNEIIYNIKDSNELSLELLLNKYMPIIKNISKKYYPFLKKCGYDYEDLIQIGSIELYNSVKNFNDEINITFYCYVTRNINNKFLNLYTISKNNPLNTSSTYENININNIKDKSKFYDNYQDNYIEYKNLLDENLKNIFELNYQGYTKEEISKILNTKVSTIYYRTNKYKEILRNYIKNNQ